MKIFKAPTLSGIDGDAVLREARTLIEKKLDQPSRRLFMQRSLTLGGLSLLTGCSISDNAQVDAALTKISRFNDKVQGLIFSPTQLAPTYTEAEITRPFPFNAYYGEDEVREVDEAGYKLEVTGHICVEGWSAIGRWGGVRFADFLRRIGADTTAKYVGFKCADDYYTSIDMPTALHPQTLLTLTYDGQPLPPKYGFPMKLRMPTKLGYKNPKHIKAMFVTNTYSGGYWEDQGYNWFGGS